MSQIGATIDNSMCDPMWALKRTCEYRPSPPNVAHATTASPTNHETVLATGQRWRTLRML